MKNKDIIFMISVFLISFSLRSMNIEFGLSAVNSNNLFHYIADEVTNIDKAMKLPNANYSTGYITPFYYYFLFIIYAIYYGILVIIGSVSDLASFARLYIMDKSIFVIIGRYVSVFVSSITIILFYGIIKRMYNRNISTISAVLYLFSYGSIVKSNELRPDHLLPLLLILGIYYSHLLMGKINNSRLAYAGIICALAVSTKPNGIMIIVPILFSVLYRCILDREVKLFFKSSGKLILYSAPIILILNYYNYISPQFQTALKVSSRTASIHIPSLGPDLHSWMFYLTKILPEMVSGLIMVLLPLSFVGIFIVKSHQKESALLFTVLVSYFLPMGYFPRATWRDMLPVLPIIYALVGYSIYSIVNYIVSSHNQRNIVILFCVLLLLLTPVKRIYSYLTLLNNQDTRELCYNYVVEKLEYGTTISVERYGPALSMTWVSYMEDIVRPKSEIDIYRNNENIYNNTISEPRFSVKYLSKDISLEGLANIPQADLHMVNWSDSLFKYVHNNSIEYIILSSRYYARWFKQSAQNHIDNNLLNKVIEFYDTIHGSFELQVIFDPNVDQNPGPKIHIYRVPKNLKFERMRRETFQVEGITGMGTIGYHHQ
jgi:hypothetical protein